MAVLQYIKMKPHHFTRKTVLIAIGLILLLSFLYLHYQEHGFRRPTAKTVYVTLKHGLNKTKDFLTTKVKSDDVTAAIMAIQTKLNEFMNKINVRTLLGDSEDDNLDVDKFHLDLADIKPLPIPDSKTLSEKWIVATGKTNDIAAINHLGNISGWKLLIVQNRRSPAIVKLPGIIVLSIDDQKLIGYETARYLKSNLYLRKNIGYLYAIQHGANVIYDTEFDKYITNIDNDFKSITIEEECLRFSGSQRFYNSLVHFGQNKLWPRGYPIDLIKVVPTNLYESCKYVLPVIQHGIVRGDPDLDAIQRLTLRGNKTSLRAYFDTKAPLVVVPPNSFVPYNSQNTLHSYDAFLFMLLLQTVTSRVSDIWRSFITQRMIWDLGKQVIFTPIKSYNRSISRNFVKELRDEEDLYLNSHLLADFLVNWDCDADDVFPRYFMLVKAIFKHGLLGASDIKLARAWIRDLVRVGYMSPKLQSSYMECKTSNYKSTEMMSHTQPNREHINEYYKSLARSTKHERPGIMNKMAGVLTVVSNSSESVDLRKHMSESQSTKIPNTSSTSSKQSSTITTEKTSASTSSFNQPSTKIPTTNLRNMGSTAI